MTIVRSRAFAPVVVGVLGILFTGFGSWVPAPWYDEAATISAAQRSLPQLWLLVHQVDVVHAVYYLGMHVWFHMVGYTPFTLRAPSALAIGLTAAVLIVLVRRFASNRTAIVAGIAVLLIPEVTWAAVEGRSYAIQTLLAVLLTLVLCLALDPKRLGRVRRSLLWAGYAALAVLACATFLYLALLVIAHGVTTAVLALAARRPDRAGYLRALLGWAAASVVAGLILIPLVRLAVGERHQVAGLSPISDHTIGRVFVTQWFGDAGWFAAVAWAAIVTAVVLLVVRIARDRTSSVTGSPSDRPLLTLAITLPWLILPTAAVIAGSAALFPLYAPRYLTFSTPAIAILMAVAFTAIRRVWLPILALVVSFALMLPDWQQQRSVDAKPDPSGAAIAAFFAQQREREPAGQMDGVLFGPLYGVGATDMSILEVTYPSQFAGFVDLRQGTPGAQTGRLWQDRATLHDAQKRVRRDPPNVIWLVTERGPYTAHITSELTGWGYHPDRHWNFLESAVVRYVRDGS